MVEKMNDVRTLNADEIECRVGQIAKDKSGCSLLLYKDARVDMRILDEVVGAGNWTRSHRLVGNNLCCRVSIWSNELGMWIPKEDVGTESNTEAVKGEYSDAFKRACFNWGIGRELYTAPFIYVKLTADDFTGDGRIKTRFKVADIAYDDKKNITRVVITDTKGTPRYEYTKGGRR